MTPYPPPYPPPLPTLPPVPTWVHLSTFEAFAVDPHGLMLWVSLMVLAIAITAMIKSRGN